MAKTEPDTNLNARVLDALVSNTEALTGLSVSLQAIREDLTEARKITRESNHGHVAKLDNLDRSMGELRLALDTGESARQAELKRIFDLLGEERHDRRVATTDATEGERKARESERDFIRTIIREELGERRQERALAATAAKEVWRVGGKYIVAAVCLLLCAAVMKTTGISLADILGLTRK